MKKILIVTNILFLFLSVFLFFRISRIRAQETGINQIQVNKPYNCKNKICKDYSDIPWRGKINGFVAKMIANNYKEDLGKRFIWNGSSRTDIEDARSAWFPLETIKRFIWDIEMQNCTKKCNDSLGLRIYYGRYPDSSNIIWRENGMEPQKKYADRHTLFMVPTYWNKLKKAHFDFNPWVEGCHMPININPDNNKQLIFPVFLIGGDEAQNHGSLIPPDAQTGTNF